jgi:hypothetical protein
LKASWSRPKCGFGHFCFAHVQRNSMTMAIAGSMDLNNMHLLKEAAGAVI